MKLAGQPGDKLTGCVREKFGCERHESPGRNLRNCFPGFPLFLFSGLGLIALDVKTCLYYREMSLNKERCPYSLPGFVNVSTIYIDESGARNSRGGFFVVGFLKVREPHELGRTIRDLRQRHQFFSEIHFARIAKKQLPFYFDLVEAVARADVRVGGSVYDSKKAFSSNLTTWEQQALMAARLIQGNVNRGELVNVFLDLVSTPKGHSAARKVKKQVNRRIGSRCILEAYDIDSKATDMVQVADIVASSINYARCNPEERKTPKAQVAARLRRALELDSFGDVQEGKVNILTMREPFGNE